MKKIFFALIALSLVFSCQDDVEFNQPAFQGIKDGDELWKATSYSVTIDENNALTFSGTSNFRELNLTVPYPTVDTFRLGDVNSMYATYEEFGNTYSTTNEPASGIVYLYGEVDIQEIDYTLNTFTGAFRFNAYNSTGTDVVNFIEGIFYKLPLSSGSIPSPTEVFTCDDAEAASAAALAAFQATDLSDSDAYEANCAAYVVALETQMIYCGSGNIPEIIEGLNECVFPCEYAEDNVANAQDVYDNAVVGTYIEACADYIYYLNEQIEYCGDEDGSIQAIIDGLNCTDTDLDGVADVFEDVNGDSDPDNDDTDLDLTADYLDDDDDNDGILTANELMFDENGDPLDTDGDNIPDYLDMDDDGDGIPTAQEDLDGDGDLTNDDTDGDGVPNYLDNDDDGDGIYTLYEDLNGDTDYNNDDSDGDMTPNYLDNDDDGDGALTADENPDPNGDGNPDDAEDTDVDGIPDYLDV